MIKSFSSQIRSVVVVCKNMNASDVQKLVPSLALSGCFNQTKTANGTKIGINNSGKCVQLKGNLFQNKEIKKDSKTNDNGCIGEKELCNKISKVASESDATTKKNGWMPKSKRLQLKGNGNNDRDCSKDDVTCTLLEKVRWYLKQHYIESSKQRSGSTALSTNKKTTKNKPKTTPRPRSIQVSNDPFLVVIFHYKIKRIETYKDGRKIFGFFSTVSIIQWLAVGN